MLTEPCTGLLSCTCKDCIDRPEDEVDSDPEYQAKQEEQKLQNKRAKKSKGPSRQVVEYPLTAPGAMRSALCFAYPLKSAEPVRDQVAAQLRRLEKFEIALQGDDYADKEHEDTNHEALTYARAAAAVLSCEFKFDEWVMPPCNSQRALDKIRELPLVGEFRSRQILELARSGTCEALEQLSNNRRPKDSKGCLRTQNAAGKSMEGAAAKLELSRVLGISALKAVRLYHGEEYEGEPVRSVAELRERGGDPPFAFGLRHHEELQQAVPEAEALEMQRVVREVVRRQQGCPDCALPPGEGAGVVVWPDRQRCSCCWHVDFAGGARRRGAAGHDADLLVWHKVKPASWEDGCVLSPLLGELEQRGHLLRGGPEGWQMKRTGHSSRKEVDGVRKHRRNLRQQDTSTRGFENLSVDYHDKVFGIWRSASTKRHHRIDIIVSSFPEEYPFVMLGWTGSRLLNRMMRQRAKDMGLFLSAHALIATPNTALDKVVAQSDPPHTNVVVRCHGGGKQLIAVKALTEVPYEFVTCEVDILRILADGREDFEKIYHPMKRNA